jgi:hypothetical protein
LENCDKLLLDLKHNLKKLESKKTNVHCFLEENIYVCKEALDNLRKYVRGNEFKNEKDEIQFYKFIKPQVSSYIIFYINVLKIESARTREGKKEQIKYLKKFITKFQCYFTNNLEFYHYFKSNASHLDEQYFLTKNKILRLNIENYHFFTDDKFSTSHDSAVATILAHRKLIKYLKDEIQKLNVVEQQIQPKLPADKEKQLVWTGTQSELVELSYALHVSGRINYGNADKKEIVEAVQNLFGIENTNYYHTFSDIRGDCKLNSV